MRGPAAPLPACGEPRLQVHVFAAVHSTQDSFTTLFYSNFATTSDAGFEA